LSSPTRVHLGAALAGTLSVFVAACGGGAGSDDPAPPLTIRVPTDQPTIAAAIAAAPSGYTILIAKGRYRGPQNTDLNLRGLSLQIRGDGRADEVIIDCEGLSRFVSFDTTDGAISSLTIRNCNLGFDGAVYALNASPSVVGNIFDTTLPGTALQGPAVFGFSSSARIEKNYFRGIRCDDQFNQAVVAFVNSSSPVISNNLFVGNPCRAVAMTLPEGPSPTVVNNTMVDNRAGIYIDRRVSTSAHWYANNLIVGNERGLEVVFEFQPRADDLVDIWRNNLMFTNASDYVGTADLTGRAGNLQVDPLLAAPPSDLRLTPSSPARDAGQSVRAPLDDFDGRVRSGTIDIGAFEYP
jgi:serine protease